MWSLYEDEKELKPLVFSNGKTQEDIVEEVIKAVEEGNKLIFIKGMCGTGKSAIALNLARKFGKTSIVVPIKSLQEQYIKDYSGKKYLINNNKKLKISSIVGRQNFKCKFLEENDINDYKYLREKNAKLNSIFSYNSPLKEKNKTADNDYLPCKIEIKERNIERIKDYVRQNPDVKISDFSSINEIKRLTIAPVCPFWYPILNDEYKLKRFDSQEKTTYLGLNNKSFTIYPRKKGCGYYEQYLAYSNSDVIIFNSLKYKLETIMDRKPLTELEIIDECDDFLDSFADKEKISLNRLLFSLNFVFTENKKYLDIINQLIDITNTIKKKYLPSEEIFKLKETLVQELLKTILTDSSLLDEIESDESTYLYHLEKVAKMFVEFPDETFFLVEKKEDDIILNLVTTNLKERLKELLQKNKVIVMMSGTIHSQSVLENIFGLEKFKIIEAETKHQGELIKCRHGYEMDCKYENFKSEKITRESYLKALSKCILCAKPPILIHLTSFSDLPTENEKLKFNLENLPTQQELINQQKEDPFGKRIADFKNKKIKILFTTKCNRGIDFPGDVCNSIIISRFPYPNISSIFWKILKRNHPEKFMNFYMDKAQRDLLQKIYRGLRAKNDRVYLLSPDIRVLNFKID